MSITTAKIIDGFQVQVSDGFADVLAPFGHVFVDLQEKTIRPITPIGYSRLMQQLHHNPMWTAAVLSCIEDVADTVFPHAASDVGWLWELPPKEVCPNCVC